MARTYDIFDPTDLGTDRELELGGIVLTTAESALTLNQFIKGQLGQTTDTHSVEFYIYGTGALSNKLSIGIVTENTPNNNYVGGHVDSIGYRVAEGQIHYAGASVEAVTAGVLKRRIGMKLDFTAAANYLSFYLEGVLLTTRTLPVYMNGLELFWAVSLGSTAPGDLAVHVTSGRQTFAFPLSGATGWWQPVEIPDALRLATREFISGPNDSPPHTRYVGCITIGGSTNVRELVFWPDGESSSARTSAISFNVLDADVDLNTLLRGVWRDVPCTFRELEVGQTLAESTILGSYVLESVEVISDGEKRLTFRDDMVLLERPLQRRFFYPDADGNAANRAWPTSLGACFNIPLQLYDEDNLYYALDSEGAQGVGIVRDRGDPLSTVASPADFTLLNGGTTIQLRYAPVGTITCDLSVTGVAYEADEYTEPDVLNDTGYPFTGAAGGPPDDWSTGDNNVSADDPYVDALGRLNFPQEYGILSWALFDTPNVMEAGKNYYCEFELVQIQGYISTVQNCIVGLSYQDTQFGAFLSANTATGVGVYSTLYSPPVTHSVYVFYTGNNVTGGQNCIVKNVRIRELVPATEVDASDELIEPLKLEPFLRQIIEVRGELPSTFWNSADAAAIDAATGYRGIGYHSSDQVAVRVPIEEAVRSYTACTWKDENGVMRVTRLIAPEDYPSEYITEEIREAHMESDLIPYLDTAPGLSKRLGVRRNWRVMNDSEIVTDDLEPSLTLALRRRLGRDYRFIATSGRPLSPTYEDAANSAGHVGTLLNDYADGRTEIDRICQIYSVDRMYYKTSIASERCPELGSVVMVYYSRYNLSAGEPMLVKRIIEDRVNRDVREIVLWGRSLITN